MCRSRLAPLRLTLCSSSSDAEIEGFRTIRVGAEGSTGISPDRGKPRQRSLKSSMSGQPTSKRSSCRSKTLTPEGENACHPGVQTGHEGCISRSQGDAQRLNALNDSGPLLKNFIGRKGGQEGGNDLHAQWSWMLGSQAVPRGQSKAEVGHLGAVHSLRRGALRRVKRCK